MKIVVIGGVAAGMSAAAKARRMLPEAEIVVYEKGGVVSYGACGLPYYVAGVLDDAGKLVVRTPEDFAEQGIRVVTRAQVTALEPEHKTIRYKKGGAEGTDRYDRLLIATGAATVRPKLPGMQLEGVYVLRTLKDGMALRAAVDRAEHVVVAGGGYVGVEVAESLRGRGKKVRLLEAAPHILAPFDPELREILQNRMTERGVKLHLAEPLAEIVDNGQGRVAAVRTEKGQYPADVVVVALGIRPATEFLAGCGLAMAPNGAIETDREMRTSLPDVWAAGDCAMVYNPLEDCGAYQPLGTVANKCGRIAGENMTGGHRVFEGALGSAAIQVCGLQAGRTGLGEDAARQKFGAVKTAFIRANDRPGYYPGHSPLWVKLICEAATGRIVGGQAVGEHGAVLRVDVLAAAVMAKMTARDLGWLDFCYAPPFSETWDALNIAGNAVK